MHDQMIIQEQAGKVEGVTFLQADSRQCSSMDAELSVVVCRVNQCQMLIWTISLISDRTDHSFQSISILSHLHSNTRFNQSPTHPPESHAILSRH